MSSQRKLTQAQESIQSAFLRELKRKPIQNVKVASLCRTASVDRSTFYAHYTDVFDLRDQMIDELCYHLFEETMAGLDPNRIGHEKSTRDMIDAALDASLRHKDLCEFLSRTSGDGIFEHKMDCYVVEQLEARYKRFIGEDPEEFHLKLILMVGGVVALWQHWILSGFRAPREQIAALIEAYISRCAVDLWH